MPIEKLVDEGYTGIEIYEKFIVICPKHSPQEIAQFLSDIITRKVKI